MSGNHEARLSTLMIPLAPGFLDRVKTFFHRLKKAGGHDPTHSLPATNAQGSKTLRADNPPDPWPTNTTEIFQGAHDFQIENFIYADGRKQTEDVRKAEEYERWKKAEEDERRRKADDALEKLLARAMPSAMLYSEARVYAPRCDEDTRRSLRSRIVEWGQNNGEIQRLLWLSGPAAVGKSAVAQTVAEELKNAEFLGGVFFFSRPNSRDDPNVVIPTLVYQLAVLLPEYKLIVGQRFKEDPSIFGKDRESQFKELISDPFLPDLSHRPLTLLSHLSEQLLTSLFHRPLLILLDGLDECNGRNAQCEFVQMIARHAQSDRDSRLRWMICSRPEPHLTLAFTNADCRGICLHERLEVDEDEAQKDALHILKKGFTDIRERYPDELPHDWPHPGDIEFIADHASGHLGFASFIVRFIGDQEYDNPSGQLRVCLKFLERTGPIDHINPLHPLDLLYTQILSDIPAATLPTTQRVLGLFILYGSEKLTGLVHANFLDLDQAAFYHSLRRLHSVVFVPRASEASTQPIRIYHASFSDYLRDEARAGEFALDEGAIHLYVATRGLQWLSHFCKEPSDQQVLPELPWPKGSTSPYSQTVLDSVCEFVFTPCWRAFPQVPEASLSTLIEALKDFDFNITYSKWEDEMQEFAYFIRWLASSDAKTLASIDHQHLDKPGRQEEIAIIWNEKDPGTFVEPFLCSTGPSNYLSIYLQLRNRTQTSFHLIMSTGIKDVCQAREDDILVAFMGHGKSDFIDLLAQQPYYPSLVRRNAITRTIRHVPVPGVRAVRAVHPEHGKRIVLVDTPGFSRNKGSEAETATRTREWVEKTYGNNVKISGIVCVLPSRSSSLAASYLNIFRTFGSLCGDLTAACVFLVKTPPTMKSISSDTESKVQLDERLWKSLIEHGANVDQLANETKEEAWRIVNRLLETANTGEALKEILEFPLAHASEEWGNSGDTAELDEFEY